MTTKTTVTDWTAYRAAKLDKYESEAADLFEAGFQSKAGQKRALESAGRAYETLREIVMAELLATRTPENNEQNTALYWAIPSGLHQVRDRHFEQFAAFPIFARVRDLVALRETIKTAAIAAPVRDAAVERVETIRRTIVEEMAARHANYVHGLDMSRLFGMQVSVNAHNVTNDKGTTFLRHFFYLRGRLTALNAICAISDTLKREEDAAALK